MAAVQLPAGPLCWQAISAAAKGHPLPPSLGRTRPLLVAAGSTLMSSFAGPSTSFATSQQFVRSASSATQPAFKLGEMYSSDPILGQRAKVLNDWNARHEVDSSLFEDDVPAQYATLRLQAVADDDLDAEGSSASQSRLLVDAIKGKRWADARDEFQALHASGGTVPFLWIYLKAALNSLVDQDIETSADRLEWFILWASLLPVEQDKLHPGKASVALLRQHRHVAEQLLCYPTHLSHLSRALVLLAEKGLGRMYEKTLLKHIVRFSPLGTGYALVESICASAGWAANSRERSYVFNTAVRALLEAGSLEEAVGVIRQARAASEPHFRRGQLTPTFALSTYLVLRRNLLKAVVHDSPLVSALDAIAEEDYPYDYRVQLSALPADRLLHVITSGRPAPDHLPRALFLLTRSSTRVSPVALSNVLEALYATDVPRPRLVALLYRRLTRARVGPSGERFNTGSSTWIAAEMMRLTRLGRPADALSLFAARFQWIAMPTADIWAAFRDYRPELLKPVAKGCFLDEPTRRLMPGPKHMALAYDAIIRMHGNDVELLTNDYRDFLSFAEPARRRTPLVSPLAPAEPTVRASTATDPSSIFEDPLPAASVLDPLFTPWTSPDVAYDLPPGLRPPHEAWQPWVMGFARLDPKLGVAVLRDMRQRGVEHDCRTYGHVFVAMVAAGDVDMAMSALDELVRMGGLSHEDGRSGKLAAAPIHNAPAVQEHFPPVTAWLYVRLIRAMVTSSNPSYSLVLEGKMREAGFALSDIEKEEMVTVYDMRYRQQLERAQRQRTTPPARTLSPWGLPADVETPGVVYIPGELSGERGLSYRQQTPIRDSSNTLLEEGYPFRARQKMERTSRAVSAVKRSRKAQTIADKGHEQPQQTGGQGSGPSSSGSKA